MDQTVPRRVMVIGSVLSIVIVVLVVATALVHLDKAIMTGLFSNHAGNVRAGAGGFRGSARGAPGVSRGPGVNPPAGGAPRGGFPAGGGARARPSGVMLWLFQNLSLLFFLNFIGYIVLAVALYLPPLKKVQRIIRWLLVAFAAITIIAYFAISGFSPNPMGYVDKILELLIIILLIIEDRRVARLARSSTPSVA
jgi:hypothetical protein